MKPSNPAIILAAVLVFFFGAAVQAQSHDSQPAKPQQPKSFSIRLGTHEILIPAPEGFEEAGSQFPDFKARVEATEAPQNDALLAFLPASDCESLRKGLNPTLNYYAKISVFRAGRELRLTAAELATAVNDIRKNGNSLLDPNSQHIKELDRRVEERLSAINSAETKIDIIGKPEIMGEFDTQPNVNSFLALIAYKMAAGGAEKTVSVLMTISLVLVKERIIFAYVFRQYESKDDLEPLRLFTKKWTSSILAAN